jgi:hypothetical protein
MKVRITNTLSEALKKAQKTNLSGKSLNRTFGQAAAQRAAPY